MQKKFQKGIIAIVPILIVATILVLGFSISGFKKNTQTFGNNKTSVLSESTDNGGGDGGGDNAQIEAPQPAETPEAIETPEPETETEFEVREGSDEAKTKITIKRNNEFTIKESTFSAQAQFPLGINPNTSQLVASTSSGVKPVPILPDQAVQNLISSGVFSQVPTGQNNIQITTDSKGNVIYEINGVKYERLLGVFDVAINKTGQVSAQNGQLVGVNQSLFSQIIDSLSF